MCLIAIENYAMSIITIDVWLIFNQLDRKQILFKQQALYIDASTKQKCNCW